MTTRIDLCTCVTNPFTPEPRDGHGANLGHGLIELMEDNCAIFQATARAKRAEEFRHELQSGGINTATPGTGGQP